MSLGSAHEGYEYQDLLTAYFILAEILHNHEADFIIDRKVSANDTFDDLTAGISLNSLIEGTINESNRSVLNRLPLFHEACSSGRSYNKPPPCPEDLKLICPLTNWYPCFNSWLSESKSPLLYRITTLPFSIEVVSLII